MSTRGTLRDLQPGDRILEVDGQAIPVRNRWKVLGAYGEHDPYPGQQGVLVRTHDWTMLLGTADIVHYDRPKRAAATR